MKTGAFAFAGALLLTALAGCAASPSRVERPAIAMEPAEVRVAFDATRITASSARGIADRTTGRRVTIDDPVRVASVSKLVVAIGVMSLVEDGSLSLDRDVSDWLGYRVRNPAFPNAQITLRHLLSHTSGLRDAVDYTIPYGSATTQTVLADPKAWETAHAPGRFFNYANVNFPIVAAVMERATGERFDRLMQRLVFEPLKIDACFNWTTCSDAKIARHVVLYRASGEVARDDLKGRRPDCPVFTSGGCDLTAYKLGENGALFSPQGGMRISMRDLARIGQALFARMMPIHNTSAAATPTAINNVAILTNAIWTYHGSNGQTEQGFYCTYGLAVQMLPTSVKGCADNLFADGRRRVGHAGEAYGLRSGLWFDPQTGRGVAFFTSAVADDSYDGRHSRFTRAEERLATGR